MTQLCQVTSWVQVHAQPNQRTSLGQSTTPPSPPNGRVECQPHHSFSLLCSRSRWLRSCGRSYPTGCGRGGTAGLPELNNIRNPIATGKANCFPRASVEEAHPFVEAIFSPEGSVDEARPFVEPILSVEASQLHSQLVWSSRVLPCQAFSCVGGEVCLVLSIRKSGLWFL